MRISKQAILVLGLTSAVLFLFNNCQPEVTFETAIEPVIGEETTGVQPASVAPPAPTSVELVKADCMNSPTLTQSFNIVFPKPQKTCDWNLDGNLAPKDQYLQARIEQTAALDLPAGATVCGMTFTFQEQQFLYDDHFLMTFDDAVLASSYDFSSHLKTDSGLSIYDWSKIAGSYWNKSLEGTHCTGMAASLSSCSWPMTDVFGKIVMEFMPEIFYEIMAHDTSRLIHDFKFISIGDNDNLDCEHSTVTFNVKVSYIHKGN